MAERDLVTNKVVPLTARSAATRARLIATAERLFAARGIEGVSLSDINLAAGQRNKNASHYHFGDKQGLLQAILDKHLPGVIVRRERLLDEMEAQKSYGIVDVVRALLYPLAEKLFDDDGGPEFIQINAQLAASHAALLNQSGAGAFELGPLERLRAAKSKFLAHLPEPVARQRVAFAISLILNALADHSRHLQRHGDDAAVEMELLIRNLEDCLLAICAAPISAVVMETLRKTGRATSPAAGTHERMHRK